MSVDGERTMVKQSPVGGIIIVKDFKKEPAEILAGRIVELC